MHKPLELMPVPQRANNSVILRQQRCQKRRCNSNDHDMVLEEDQTREGANGMATVFMVRSGGSHLSGLDI